MMESDDPVARVDTGHTYVNDIGGRSELMYADDLGQETQITSDGAVNSGALGGTVAIANGGTGQTTKTAAFDALSPVTTQGDIIIRGVANNVRLPIGGANQVLLTDGTDPSWGQVSLTGGVTGTLPVANGGTGVTSSTGSTNVVLSNSPTIVTPTIASFANAGHDHQAAAGGGQLDHGLAITGLLDDDHTIYALLLGRAGGTVLIGGTGVSDTYTLRATSNATGGDIIFESDPGTEVGRFAVGTGFTSVGFLRTASTTLRSYVELANGATATVSSGGESKVRSNAGTLQVSNSTAAYEDVRLGTVAINEGGTAATTATAAFNNLSPVTTRGDIIIRDASNNVRLAIGAADRVLLTDGTDPSWGQVSLTGGVTGTLPVANGGTGVTSSTGTGNTVLSASPTITGTLTTAAISATMVTATAIGNGSASALRAVSTGPALELRETDAAADEKSWDIAAGSGNLSFRTVNDANSAASTYMLVERTGITVNNIQLSTNSIERMRISSADLALTVPLGFGATTTTVDVVLLRGAPNRLDLASGDSFRLVSGNLEFGVDVFLTRGAANRLDLATGDSFVIQGGSLTVNEGATATGDLRVEGESLQRLLATDASAASENVILLANTAPDTEEMDRGLFIGNATTVPTTSPVGGGFMFIEAGAATWLGTSGTETVFGAAGPRCGNCGYDFWRVAARSRRLDAHLRECGMCGTVYKKGPASILDQLTVEEKKELIYE